MATKEQINAAAKAIYEGYSDVRASWTTWSSLDVEAQDYFKDLAKAALEAVSTQLAAEPKDYVQTSRKCETCGKPAIIRLNNEDMCADCHADYWADQGVGAPRDERARLQHAAAVPEDIAEAQVDEKIARSETHFRSCPACRGSGKLDLRCSICEGRGSVGTDEHGNMEATTEDGAKRLLEAASVAVLPTNEFTRMKANFQRETMEWGVRWLRSRAKNMQATQDYIGEHRLNQAADLLQKDFEEMQND